MPRRSGREVRPRLTGHWGRGSPPQEPGGRRGGDCSDSGAKDHAELGTARPDLVRLGGHGRLAEKALNAEARHLGAQVVHLPAQGSKYEGKRDDTEGQHAEDRYADYVRHFSHLSRHGRIRSPPVRSLCTRADKKGSPVMWG
ncbi:hypothetical protein SVEN_2890 [Streptomyces venezuelae ATCC 10712]|uniref:Uncharacterized protein n=1 Tax=Streptomyces venezuelae (strain ATCC 10712 / CBS 650.69 / DSM 40230 / JCM 4526 / NBRC 13096 / PD 04745) TaxID=953739 RepID=F2R6C5_STRVP|nr:hypothetical protein SVEN_2890 [Streptomyces venezuelae ATCC 10712]